MDNGCMCCTIRGDLAHVRMLFSTRVWEVRTLGGMRRRIPKEQLAEGLQGMLDFERALRSVSNADAQGVLRATSHAATCAADHACFRLHRVRLQARWAVHCRWSE